MIVQDCITGFHFHGLDELVAVTRRLLEAMSEAERATLLEKAEAAAQAYSEATFHPARPRDCGPLRETPGPMRLPTMSRQAEMMA